MSDKYRIDFLFFRDISLRPSFKYNFLIEPGERYE